MLVCSHLTSACSQKISLMKREEMRMSECSSRDTAKLRSADLFLINFQDHLLPPVSQWSLKAVGSEHQILLPLASGQASEQLPAQTACSRRLNRCTVTWCITHTCRCCVQDHHTCQGQALEGNGWLHPWEHRQTWQPGRKSC